MAKSKKTANDVSEDILNSLNEMQKAARRLNLSRYQGKTAKALDVCEIYGKIKPYLELVKNLPLIPKKIREAIALLMTALDTMCPR